MKIAILSRGPKLYSTRRLVEAAEKRGHEVIVLNHLKCVLVIEKGAPQIFYGGKEITGIDAIIPRIGTSVTYYGAAVVRQFEQMKVFSSVTSKSLVRSRDKLRCLQLLGKAGIDMPKTAFASIPKNIDTVIEQVGGAPVVIKLVEGTQGLGVILAETHKSAKSVIESFLSLKANILVQEFIQESEGADIRAFVVDGKVVGAMKRQGNPDEFRSNIHRGGKAMLHELTDDERETAIRAANELELAVAGVDMLQSVRGPLVVEVNSSPGLEGIEKATGTDIAERIIEYIEKNESNIRKA